MNTQTPIEVLSVYTIIDRIRNNGRIYNACISIGSSDSPTPPGLDIRVKYLLRLQFDDIYSRKDLPKEQNPFPPNIWHIRRIIKFYESTIGKTNGYTVHCHAGVHRSVAAAMMLLYLMSGSNEFVKDRIIKAKAFPLPNKKMIELFDREMGANLTELIVPMENRLREFLKGNLEIDKDDYLEELDSIE
jgi:predicted protein tyrosine phosphatase